MSPNTSFPNRFIAHTLNNLAIIAGRRADMEEARSLCLESLQMRNEVGERLGMAESLGTMAWLLSRLPLTEGSEEQVKAMERAAMLWGAAAGLRDSMGAALPAEERGLYEEGHTRARTLLGKATVQACEIVGRSMRLQQAIEQASLANQGLVVSSQCLMSRVHRTLLIKHSLSSVIQKQ